MNLNAIPAKTDQAKEALKNRDIPMSRAQRAMLIMIDGSKPLSELSGAFTALGLTSSDLAHLTQAGFIDWRNREHSTDREAPAHQPPRPAASNKSVAAAKLFALDLAGRMLPNLDQPIRESARDVTAAEHLVPWLEGCAGLIGARAGDERASLFLEKVMAVVPDDLVAMHRSSALQL